MQSNILFALTLLLLGVSNLAWSQDCGGMSAVNGVCIPPDSPTSPLYSTYGNEASSRAPQHRWQLTWGAIAMSTNNDGDLGVTIGKFSKREAGRDAIAKCEGLGGSKCELILAYHNQCGVIAWPSIGGKAIGGFPAIVRGGPTIEDASQGALASCSVARGGGECKIIYSDCTKPVLVR